MATQALDGRPISRHSRVSTFLSYATLMRPIHLSWHYHYFISTKYLAHFQEILQYTFSDVDYAPSVCRPGTYDGSGNVCKPKIPADKLIVF